ncbi:hypothetical protein NHX12_017935 [Muraenolepis orangiensis]|uniref:CASAMP N-terminal domain-containing protein n=1 Tax=Muraenolepis orangiensis TaxID=630683 RepID=A0A9Q0EVM6_9TELE|nr:hypothetical protein NHX12_017935 [Muraenolepis orangiensis]
MVDASAMKKTFTVSEIKPLDQYDFNRAKICASVRWLLSKSYGSAGKRYGAIVGERRVMLMRYMGGALTVNGALSASSSITTTQLGLLVLSPGIARLTAAARVNGLQSGQDGL